MKKNIKVVNKLVLRFLLVVMRHAQSTQNNKFAVYFRYFRKEIRAKVDCLHASTSYNIISDGKTELRVQELFFLFFANLPLKTIFLTDLPSGHAT